jgi:galactosylceramidase
MKLKIRSQASGFIGLYAALYLILNLSALSANAQTVHLNGKAGGKRFDGVGAVSGGGATSVLLKDYPEEQRNQILDLLFKPKFGASINALMVEVPGDGNSTQGSEPSHMHTKDDLNFNRGYEWWLMSEAKKRNEEITLDANAWSSPAWIGNGVFWSQDMCDYYVKWIQGLKTVHGLTLDAIGCRNEKGVSIDFVKKFRKTLDAGGLQNVKIHAFDNWGKDKFDWVKNLETDLELRNAVAIIGNHTMSEVATPKDVIKLSERLNKPIWNTEEHTYKEGFDCEISLVKSINENFVISGATKLVSWYLVGSVYPTEPYAETPAAMIANSPWSGFYKTREVLWGYAHYGQFAEIGWQYLNGASDKLDSGGTYVTLKSPGKDYSVIFETQDAKVSQIISFKISGGLSDSKLCVWRSNEKEQFVRLADITPKNSSYTITLDPKSIYSISTTTGQQKGSFAQIPAESKFPFPYYETFDEYAAPKQYGYLPHYTADIYGAFELTERPDNKGKCLRQVVPMRPISWAPGWQPYTILGDDKWQDYEISANVYLNQGDSAAVMGRVNDVGSGYGTVPKGYFLQLGSDGQCRLVVSRGKREKNTLVGDAEQQALIKAGKDYSEGGEKILGVVKLTNVSPDTWHNLKLRFKGSAITALVDGKPVLNVTDTLYSHGMAGLLALGGETKLSMPYFDNLSINAPGAKLPTPTVFSKNITPMYKKIQN